jgi:outer membrane protein assembly factor BamB
MKTKISIHLFSLLAVLGFAASLQAGNWPNWRGPNHDGSTTAGNLPTKFSKTENIKWTINLPGPSAGTPIVWDNKIFVSSTVKKDGSLLAICIDRKSGKTLWKDKAGSGYRPGGAGSPSSLDNKSNYASPSPVTDGKVVVFFYGNGDLVAYTLNGKRMWDSNLQKDYGDFTFQWTFSSSPTLYEGRLYMQILQRDEPVHGRGKQGNESFLLAIDPSNGKVIWKHNRPSKANKESLESFATPIPFEGAGRKELVIVGGDVLTGHDPVSGNELWRWGTWNEGHKQQWWRLVPSPVIGGGVILACGPKKAPVFAAKVGLKGTHSGKDGQVWNSGAGSPVTTDVPTPLFYKGKFYVLSDLRKAMSKVDPATGKIEWTVEMPGKYKWRGSPTAADNKIYFMNHNGEVVVMDPESGKILHKTSMGEQYDDNTRSSIAIADNQLFIRTNEKLYCVQ